MTDVVTGAFSYTGRFVAARLLAGGRDVRTLSRSPRSAGDPDVPVSPLQFEDTAALAESLRGVETLTFAELVQAVRHAVGSCARIVRTSPAVALGLTRLAGLVLRDIVLTRDELRGLEDSLLVSRGSPTGTARFGDWLAQNGEGLGRSYVSELARNWEGLARH